ncbi:MAG: hypothetical protein ACI4Q4_02570 [Oscillospiraceae bacterium]
MAKISLAVYGSRYEWLGRLKDFIEDKWVVNISDITYEAADGKHVFNIMLNTLGDFDRVSGRTAPSLRKSESTVLAYALACMGSGSISPEDCVLHFGATFEDGIRSFLYENLSERYAAELREKYFAPDDEMTEFVVHLGKAFCIFKTQAAMRRFMAERAAQLKEEMIFLLRKLDTFGVITDLEHVVFCRTEDRKREILPGFSEAISPALLIEAMSDRVRRDAAAFAGSALDVDFAAVEYRFDASALCHRFTLVPAFDEDRQAINWHTFAGIEAELCTAFRQALGGDVGRGEVVSCTIARDSFETFSKKHIHRCMEQDKVVEKLRSKYMSGYIKKIVLFGVTAVVVVGSVLGKKRFELTGAMDSLNETMKSVIHGYDALNIMDYERDYVRCMTMEEYKKRFERI